MAQWLRVCRGHGLQPWSGRIPYAAERLGPWATMTEPARLEPVLCNKRGPSTSTKSGPRSPQLEKALAQKRRPNTAIKKNEIMPFAAPWMDLEIITLSEVSQRKTNTIWYHLYVESEIWHKWTYLRNRNRFTDTENRLVVAKGRGRGGMNWEFGISRCKLLCIEWMNNKVLLYSPGNYIQYPMINHNGTEYKKECICMYNWVTLLYSRN